MKKEKYGDKKNLYFLFLSISIPLVGLILIIMPALFSRDYEIEIEKRKTNQLLYVEVKREDVLDELKGITSDLYYLSKDVQFTRFIEEGTSEQREVLVSDWSNFAQSMYIYNQLRYIDIDGNEIIRINKNEVGYKLADSDCLQNKADRYYFEETIKLDQEQIYISPFDLNVENNVVELPFKPMIRFAMPVFDDDFQKRGMIVLNYLGQNLLNVFEAETSFYPVSQMLLNSDGYWLFSDDSERDWGFMFEDRRDDYFENVFPGTWKNINTANSGQFENEYGIFTFSTLHPFMDIEHFVNSKPSTDTNISLGGYFWKIVTCISGDRLKDIRLSVFNTYFTYSVVLSLFAIVFSSIIAMLVNRNRISRRRIIKQHEELMIANQDLSSYNEQLETSQRTLMKSCYQ
jgi:hypothetical protein